MWHDNVYLIGLLIPELDERVRLMQWLPAQFGEEAPTKERLVDPKYNWNANTFYANLGKVLVYVRGRDRALKMKMAWVGAIME